MEECKFSKHERIVFVDAQGGGRVLEVDVSRKRYLVQCDDGFEMWYSEDELGKLKGNQFDVPDHYVDELKKVESKGQLKSGKKKSTTPVIDLHIEELLDSHKGMTNHEILQLQMTEFRRFFQKAKSRRWKKIEVIHGVGEGRLRNEIHDFLRDRTDVKEFYSGNIQQGTTIIELKNH